MKTRKSYLERKVMGRKNNFPLLFIGIISMMMSLFWGCKKESNFLEESSTPSPVLKSAVVAGANNKEFDYFNFVTYNTVIFTNTGSKPAIDIKEGDMVLCSRELGVSVYQKVTKVFIAYDSEVFGVRLSNEKTIHCNKNTRLGYYKLIDGKWQIRYAAFEIIKKNNYSVVNKEGRKDLKIVDCIPLVPDNYKLCGFLFETSGYNYYATFSHVLVGRCEKKLVNMDLYIDNYIKGTGIQTKSGIVAIENLKVGDLVLSRNFNVNPQVNEYKRITGIKHGKINKYMIVKLNNNQLIGCSHESLFEWEKVTTTVRYYHGDDETTTKYEGGWAPADYIMNKNKPLYNGLKILSVTEKESTDGIDVYALSVESNHNFFIGKSGILVHNSEQVKIDWETHGDGSISGTVKRPDGTMTQINDLQLGNHWTDDLMNYRDYDANGNVTGRGLAYGSVATFVTVDNEDPAGFWATPERKLYERNPDGTYTEHSSNDKIICAELHRQGFMNEDIFSADEKFGALLKNKYPMVLTGYHAWAKPVVKLMQHSKSFTRFINAIATPWSIEMAHYMGIGEGSFVGKILMIIGIAFCAVLGFIISYGLFIALASVIIAGLLFVIRRYKTVAFN